MGKARGRQSLTPALQIAAMRNRFPSLRLVDPRHHVWRGSVTPIEGGRVFTLEVHSNWKRAGRPRARVVDPKLVNMPGSSVPPHTFADGTLCLYHINDYRWSGDQRIADTIVPWACEWCFYYEVWLATGEWISAQFPHVGPKPASTDEPLTAAETRRAA
jgi:hypothetical protein